jgi:hypothetical protein
MTDRLNQLLHAEADRLDVPPVAADVALSRGRSLYRRRTVAKVGAVAAVLAVIGGVGLLATSDDGERAVQPAGPAGAANVPAFGFESSVYVGDKTATVPDTVHSLHYTSEGVLVRSNPNDGASDGSGPESLTLVRYDGSTVDLGTIPEGVGPATDPSETIYVLAEPRDDGFVAVVRDAETGDVVDEVPLPDLPPSYWEVPPLALDGGTLYVGYKNETASVDLATGDQHIVEGMAGGIPEVFGSRILTAQGTTISVLNAATGELVRKFEVGFDAFGTLAPDGRNLSIYDVATGELVDLAQLADTQDLGWTAAGDVFAVSKGTLISCDIDAGDCSERAVSVPKDAFVKLGGHMYES